MSKIESVSVPAMHGAVLFVSDRLHNQRVYTNNIAKVVFAIECVLNLVASCISKTFWSRLGFTCLSFS